MDAFVNLILIVSFVTILSVGGTSESNDQNASLELVTEDKGKICIRELSVCKIKADIGSFAKAPSGPKGDKGEIGLPGLQGLKGDQGPPGSQGPTGLPGAKGIDGPQGIQGPTGPPGSKGDQGHLGEQGPPGPPGAKGIEGQQGIQGAPGLPGAKGIEGEQGIQGPTGPQGPKGETGQRGEQGLQGFKGSKGDQGATGSLGPTGPPGPKGEPGQRGVEGPTGAPGPKGDQGERGKQGSPGPAGPQGLPGANGICPCFINRKPKENHGTFGKFKNSPGQDLCKTAKLAKSGEYFLCPEAVFTAYCDAESLSTCVLKPKFNNTLNERMISYGNEKEPFWLSGKGLTLENLYGLSPFQLDWLQERSLSVTQTIRYHCLNSSPVPKDNPHNAMQMLTTNHGLIGPNPTQNSPFRYFIKESEDGCSSPESKSEMKHTDIVLATSFMNMLPIVDFLIKDIRNETQAVYIEHVELCFG